MEYVLTVTKNVIHVRILKTIVLNVPKTELTHHLVLVQLELMLLKNQWNVKIVVMYVKPVMVNLIVVPHVPQEESVMHVSVQMDILM